MSVAVEFEWIKF